jgi:hypothetical protein
MGRTVNIVSDLGLWRRRAPDALAAGINVPASVPAFLALEGSGLSTAATSAHLRPADYQTVWEESLRKVWGLIERARSEETAGAANEVHVHGYSLYLLWAQLRIFHRFLDKLHAAHGVDGISIEEGRHLEDGDGIPFSFGVYSNHFHEASRVWALEKGVGLRVVREEGRGGAPRAAWRGPAEPLSFLRDEARRLAARWHSVVNVARSMWYVARGGRRLLCYLPFPSAGLAGPAPAWALDLSLFLKGLNLLAGFLGRPAAPPPERETAGAPSAGAVFERRFEARLRRASGRGGFLFGVFRRALAWAGRRGFDVAYAAVEPFREDDGMGYVAEAFRKAGRAVAGIQHGGNARLPRRAGLPTVLVDGLGGTFLQWGDASSDECAELGLMRGVRCVRAGSPSIQAFVKRASRRRAAAGGVRRLLYVPTYVGVYTTIGNVAPWDRYIALFKDVLSVLEASPLECHVKVLRRPEMDAFDLSRYPRIRWHRRGSLADHVRAADCVVVDSLCGAAAYEVLASGKPAVVYAGIEDQSWDERFVDDVKRRAACYFDAASYIEGLRRFAADPASFGAPGGGDSDGFVRKYLNPVEPREFWASAAGAVFGPGGRAHAA